MSKTVFFTICSDRFYYQGGGLIFINSFKRFHPDIDLVVFRQDTMDKYLDLNLDRARLPYSSNGKKASYSTAKPFIARLLSKKYKKVVNMDADTVITGRLDAILADDWDVGGAWNLNDYENASFENITPEMYVQCGLVASTTPLLWEKWNTLNTEAFSYKRFENDILNRVLYNDPKIKKLRLKIFDKDKDYYGVKSLTHEHEMYIENNELMLKGEKVKAYHQAKGSTLPKLRFETLGFTPQVVDWLYNLGVYGQSITIKGI